MPTLSRSKSRSLVENLLFAALAVNVPVSLLAQDEEGSVYELSPFTVGASDSEGYRATSSLAGSRLKTDLKDIASQIDVITMEFADDIGATSIEDLYEYSTSMESSKDYAGAVNSGVDGLQGSRVRGFDGATQSSDFFKTNLGDDLYNKERITIANGPNSILFGLGLPGGIVNTQTKTAAFKSSNKLQFQVDDWGGIRAIVDFNRVLLEKKLAFRFAALDKEGESYRPSEFDDQRRYYGSLTFRPIKGSTFKLKYEDIERDAAKGANFVAQDFVSPWYEAGKPLYDNSTGGKGGKPGNASINNKTDPFFNRNNNKTYGLLYGAVDTIGAVAWAGTALTKGPHQVPDAVDTRDRSLTNYDILPAHVDPRVGGRYNQIEASIVRASWEQRITQDLNFEVAYSKEKKNELRGGTFRQGNAFNLRGDPNMYLNDGVTPNPNAGMLYIESDPRVEDRYDVLEELRLTVSYEFDFSDRGDDFVSKLGRHRFAGLYSHFDEFALRQDHRGFVTGGDALPVGSFVGSRFYLDPGAGVYTATPLQDSPFGPWTVVEPMSGESVTVSTIDNPNGAWRAASLLDTNVESEMIAVQSFFLENKLNVFYGLRGDAFEIRGVDPDTIQSQENSLFPSMDTARIDRDQARLDGDGSTSTFGIVARPLSWLSFHYNTADNFQVPNGKKSAFGESLPGVSSEGDDFGIRLDFSKGENRFSLRVNRYTDSQLFLQSNLSQDLRNMASDVELALRDPAVIADYDPSFVAPAPFFFLQDIGERRDNYAGYTRKAAKGTDIVGTGSFGKNLNVRLAIGQQQTLVFDRAKQFRDWVAERLPVWQDAGGLGWDTVTVDVGDNPTIEEFYNDTITPQIRELEGVDGLPRFRQREWRASMFANYKFTEGPLNKFNAGLGVRWRDNSMVTAQVVRDENDEPIAGEYNKRFAPEQWYFDLAFGYTTKLDLGGRNIKWKIGLNVKNLALHDELYELRSNNELTGPLDLAYDQEPQVLLTNTLTF